MLFLNMLFLILLTASSIGYTYKNRSELACMDGMIFAMVLGAMSSISLGLNIQVSLVNDLGLATILAVLIGMSVGFLTGKIVSLTASIEGVMAGIMGGLMSPMLGAMLAHPMMLIWFMDIAYILVLVLLVSLAKEARQAFLEESREAGREPNTSP
ncbi:hypothetical protein P9761_14630 [Brevibacillus centrosporus]|uniref:hypothetical protein n=1 Tax=Brevibacillus centrosporus TaxID=54910 RepID=UPI000F0A3510|nr:hypothetical protein [Brevibacillus centrosporus]MEC2132274.1 hypothetical protein [Brevibacillus centrosporus]MED4909425.1 hypothetical protein [Brevibacillus centrosporus]RNB72387.1 hypothetical protein EDM55_06170 [Brevibacillus centrosporus]GED33854.1 hypothetical protein BCE02nite_49950 [Brevibacillus centrosporus]